MHNIESRALLMHRNTSTGVVDMTLHEVMGAGGEYVVGAGRVIGASEKNTLSAIMEDRAADGLQLIHPRVLAQTSYAISWFIPTAERELVFKLRGGVTGDYERVRATLPLIVATYCQGRLYFACTKLKSKRPDNDTALYVMPLPNYYDFYGFCSGSVSVAQGATPNNIEAWESYLFDSAHTHLGRPPLLPHDDAPCQSMEELVEIYRQHAGKGRFPSKRLVPMGITLGEWLAKINSGVTGQ